MNTENYRLIPNEEYERVFNLANLHEKAIKEIVTETISEQLKEIEIIKNDVQEIRNIVTNFNYAFHEAILSAYKIVPWGSVLKDKLSDWYYKTQVFQIVSVK